MLPRMVRSPVDICFGTSPSQAPKSRPLQNTSPVPIAATIALEMMGPMPRHQPLAVRILTGERFNLVGEVLNACIQVTPV